MICSLTSVLLHGTSIDEISIQVDVSKRGFPYCRIVGLPHRSVAESRDRIKSAILNSGLTFPRSRTTINLSPADMPKQGAQLDIAIATALMCAQGYVPANRLQGVLLIGELSLDGCLLPVRGLRAMIQYAQKTGYETVYYPSFQVKECADIEGITCFPVPKFIDLINHLRGISALEIPRTNIKEKPSDNSPEIDFKNILGQKKAKRALLIAAAGRHHVIMKGPPGIGKTLLAQAMHSIIPHPDNDEHNRIRSIQSIVGSDAWHASERPFINPLPTTTLRDFLGEKDGNSISDVTKAFGGVLFMDELPEFRKESISTLKKILETEQTRDRNFQLIAAQNPCPCGNYGHPKKKCICQMKSISRYREKISDAILDRIDIHITLQDVEYSHSAHEEVGSSVLQSQSEKAKKFATVRLSELGISANAHISLDMVEKVCKIDPQSQAFIDAMMIKHGLSIRAYHSILKVSRTIADLYTSKTILLKHVEEAVRLRGLEEKNEYVASHIAF